MNLPRHARLFTGCLAAALWAIPLASLADNNVVSVAGTGRAENNGNAGPADKVNIGQPFGVEIGPDGGLFITEVQNHRVWRLDLRSGELKTVAGTGRKGYSGDGGPALKAELNEPYEVRFDGEGNMFFVEMQNHVVRRVDARTGNISTVAGTGEKGFSGDGGPAIQARFQQPHSIALDHKGGLFIADIGNHRIRRVDIESNTVETYAGTNGKMLPQDGQRAAGNPVLGPRALYIDDGVLWVALREGHSVWRIGLTDGIWRSVAGSGQRGFSEDGGRARLAMFNGPKGIAVGPDKLVYVVDTENHAIRRIDVGRNQIETLFGGPSGDAADRADSRMDRPHGVCVGADGAVYVTDTLNHRVLRWTPSARHP